MKCQELSKSGGLYSENWSVSWLKQVIKKPTRKKQRKKEKKLLQFMINRFCVCIYITRSSRKVSFLLSSRWWRLLMRLWSGGAIIQRVIIRAMKLMKVILLNFFSSSSIIAWREAPSCDIWHWTKWKEKEKIISK